MEAYTATERELRLRIELLEKELEFRKKLEEKDKVIAALNRRISDLEKQKTIVVPSYPSYPGWPYFPTITPVGPWWDPYRVTCEHTNASTDSGKVSQAKESTRTGQFGSLTISTSPIDCGSTTLGSCCGSVTHATVGQGGLVAITPTTKTNLK